MDHLRAGGWGGHDWWHDSMPWTSSSTTSSLFGWAWRAQGGSWKEWRGSKYGHLECFSPGARGGGLRLKMPGRDFIVFKNLPGQRIGAKPWFDHFSTFLAWRAALWGCRLNPCLLRSKKAVLLVHVDDIMVKGESKYVLEGFVPKVRSRFDASLFLQWQGLVKRYCSWRKHIKGWKMAFWSHQGTTSRTCWRPLRSTTAWLGHRKCHVMDPSRLRMFPWSWISTSPPSTGLWWAWLYTFPRKGWTLPSLPRNLHQRWASQQLPQWAGSKNFRAISSKPWAIQWSFEFQNMDKGRGAVRAAATFWRATVILIGLATRILLVAPVVPKRVTEVSQKTFPNYHQKISPTRCGAC